MAPLVSVAELATWCRQDIESDDPFALVVLDGASLLVREAAGHPEWDAGTAPARAKLICVLVAKRTFLNPDQEVATSVGPLSSRVLDEAAAGMRLTETEIAELAALDAASSPPRTTGGLWVQPYGSEPRPPVMFLRDSLQGALVESWDVPYLDLDANGFAAPDDFADRP